ncbi:MAG: EscR/YscR/HrcR family type III secretion system export apparatus protein [Polyangiaceae bacterium]
MKGAAIPTDDLLGQPIVLVVALALASLLPFAFVTVTAFVKIATVLQIVRGAIGAQNVPSSTIVMALAGALTMLAMAPVTERIAGRIRPLASAKGAGDTVALIQAGIEAVVPPVRDFLVANASEKERLRFLEVARSTRTVQERSEVQSTDLIVVVPAFLVTELGEAFAAGFLIYLPFLVIDLVVSNVLLALGMQMMSPAPVSLPFKLLLFVAIDGWGLLAQSLVTGYHAG